MKIEIPFRTFARLFFALVFTFLLIEIKYELLLFFLAMIIAITMHSFQKVLIKKGLSKKITSPLIIFLYLAALVAVVFLIIPNVIRQIMDFIDHFGQIKSQILENEFISVIEKNATEYINSSPEILTSAKNYLAALGKQTLGGLLDTGILFISSIYMFLDGPRSYQWCRSHFKEKTQLKLDRTVEEIEPIMAAYVFGQFTISTIAAIVVYTTASFLKIPAALTLGFLAALFDILPGIGLILIIITTSLLALAVSIKATITIALILVGYHFVENYILAPYIYGNRMKISPLVVLLSLILAATIAGVVGMIAILPIVASYNTIEKLWLRGKTMKLKFNLCHRPEYYL